MDGVGFFGWLWLVFALWPVEAVLLVTALVAAPAAVIVILRRRRQRRSTHGTGG